MSLKIARVALQWSDDSFLTTPDPSDARIVFESQTAPIENSPDATGVFLQLSIPVKLKGIFAHAPVHIHIHPSQIQSPTYSSENIPETVQTKMPGRLARFSMKLREPIHLIIPSNTPSPLRARSRASGLVLDALRSLSRATELSIYMEDQETTWAHLQLLCGLLAAEEDASLPPPRYDELGPGPPMPPISESKDQSTKRRRQRRSNSSTSSDVLALGDAPPKKPDLRASPPRPSAVQQRLDILEVLVQTQARQIDELLADNKLQKERIRECESDIGAVRLAAERAHARVEELELEMAVQRDDMERLDGDVQYCREQEEDMVEVVTDKVSDRIVDVVADAVTDRIATRGLIARNISFSLGDE
ncbi:ubiquitin-conjugating enzyme/RWD-like protein [Apiospora arundinis]